ncbi:hypothetical protein [Campylobacter fetus]|uniref:hypothetical protein n=1 Tax=Campylobacter fetus TaxID=196 RepID=UPI00138E403E|nr:hypothetical protein [Campylobacter fetus]
MAIILLIFVCTLHAFICSAPGFIIGFWWDIDRYKKYIFFILVLILSAFLEMNRLDASFSNIIISFLEDILGAYFGLFVLLSFKNMVKRTGLCKICDKFRRKREKFDDN